MKIDAVATGAGVAPAENTDQDDEEDQNDDTYTPPGTAGFNRGRDRGARRRAGVITSLPALEGKSNEDEDQQDDEEDVEHFFPRVFIVRRIFFLTQNNFFLFCFSFLNFFTEQVR